MNFGINQSYTLKGSNDVVELCRVGFQELSACRNIIEEVANHEVAAHRASTRLLTSNLASCYREMCADFFICHASFQFHLRHSYDRRQSLATKSHCLQSKQVVGLTNLRSSMTFESKASISLRHSFSVVDNLNRGSTCINDKHVDTGSTSINGIFNQFLYYRCWTLYHLTCSNLISYSIRQQLYYITHNYSSFCNGTSLRAFFLISVPSILPRHTKTSIGDVGRI